MRLQLKREHSTGACNVRFWYTLGAVLAATLLLQPYASLGATWAHIPLPGTGTSVTAMTAGAKYLVVTVRDSADADLGVYRTPLEAPGAWEHRGLVGKWLLGVTVAGSDDQYMLVAAAGPTKVFRTSDAGLQWVASDAGITEAVVQSCTGNGVYPGVVYAPVYNWGAPYGAGIRRSTDFGLTWQLWSACQGCITQGFPAVDVLRQASGRAFAALYGGFFQSSLYLTTNAGVSWIPSGSHPVDDQYAVDVALSTPALGRRMMLGPTLLAVWENNVWQGNVETPTTMGAGNIGVKMPAWDGQSVYVAGVNIAAGETTGALGVYRSVDPRVSDSWVAEAQSLETGVTGPAQDWARYRFVAAPFARILALAVPNRGVWIGHVDGSSAVYGREPSSGATVTGGIGRTPMCTFEVRETTHATVQLLDVTGRVVGEAREEWWTPGRHVVAFSSSSNYPSGAYQVRVRAESGARKYQLTGRVVVVK